jgi:hypothetical protein
MPRKRVKIISRATVRAAKAAVPVTPDLPNFNLSLATIKRQIPLSIPKEEETETDRLFRLIYEQSRIGYCFTEPDTGIPFIRHDDIEEKGNGLFVIRFRCPIEYTHNVYFGCLADAVCKELNSDLNFFHSTNQKYGIHYEECVWVLQRDGRKPQIEDEEDNPFEDNFDSLEEFPDDFKDESTAEEIQARFDEAIANFL